MSSRSPNFWTKVCQQLQWGQGKEQGCKSEFKDTKSLQTYVKNIILLQKDFEEEKERVCVCVCVSKSEIYVMPDPHYYNNTKSSGCLLSAYYRK